MDTHGFLSCFVLLLFSCLFARVCLFARPTVCRFVGCRMRIGRDNIDRVRIRVLCPTRMALGMILCNDSMHDSRPRGAGTWFDSSTSWSSTICVSGPMHCNVRRGVQRAVRKFCNLALAYRVSTGAPIHTKVSKRVSICGAKHKVPSCKPAHSLSWRATGRLLGCYVVGVLVRHWCGGVFACYQWRGGGV